MSERIYDGPNGLRLWLDNSGNVGFEWHCPTGGCQEWRGRIRECPDRHRGVCTDWKKGGAAMRNWAIREFHGFAKLFEERA